VDDFNKNTMFKVVPFKHNEKNMVAEIRFTEERFSMRIIEIKAVTSESLFDLKTNFFPQWYKSKSIKNFKKIREFSKLTKEYLEKEYDGTKDKTAENKGFIENLVKKIKVFEKKLD
jgi:hypothetical protein